MKKICFILAAAIIIVFVFCYFGLNKSFELQTDQDFIKFALEAERRLVTVYFVANPEMLKKLQIKPVKIKSRHDVAIILKPYWDQETVNLLWKSGSSLKSGLPFGFYTEMDTGLLEASQIKVIRKGPKKVIVTGKVGFQEEIYDRKIVLVHTRYGWKAFQ